MYRRILFPHDGSDLAEIAVPHLEALASIHDAEVVLLHVVQTDAAASAEPSLEPPEGAAHNVRVEEMRERLHSGGVVAVRGLVAQGEPAATIVHAVHELQCDLVVMATHARSGLGRLMAGSVSEAVIRHRPGVPVMLVTPPEHEDADEGAGDGNDEGDDEGDGA